MPKPLVWSVCLPPLPPLLDKYALCLAKITRGMYGEHRLNCSLQVLNQGYRIIQKYYLANPTNSFAL